MGAGTLIRWFMAFILVVLLAGCGSSSSVVHLPSPGGSIAAANTKLVVYGIASTSEATLSSLGNSVAGPVVPYLIRRIGLLAAAYANAGESDPAGSATQISGGYQVLARAGLYLLYRVPLGHVRPDH